MNEIIIKKKSYKWFYYTFSICLLFLTFMLLKQLNINKNIQEIKLSKPQFNSKTSIEHAIKNRRSIRIYQDEKINFKDISQLLWAAQGITDIQNNFKAAPSAGATYPITIYLLTNKVQKLQPGIYKYIPSEHKLIKILNIDKRNDLYEAAFSQTSIKNAPASIIICGNYKKITEKYEHKGKQYLHIEVGTIAQNIYLQAVSLKLGTVLIGAFNEEKIQEIIKLSTNEKPFAILPIGKI